MNREFNDMKQYAEPNFPAQDAWKNMQEILNKEMPVQEKRKKRFVFFWLFALMLCGSGIYFFNTSKNIAKNKNVVVTNEASSLNKNEKNKTETVEANSQNISTSQQQNITTNNDKNATSIVFENSNKIVENTKVQSDSKNSKANIFNELYSIKKRSSKKEINSNSDDKYYSISTPQINVLKRIADKQNGRIVSDNNVAVTVQNAFSSNNNSSINIATNDDEIKNNSPEKTIAKLANEKKNITTTNVVVKVPKNKLPNSLHYGLQWNVLLPQANNYLDFNAKSQPLSVAIPEFWVSKELSKKSEIALQLNPYSQYTLRSKNVMVFDDYPVTVYQGSNPTPTIIHYTRTRSLIKAIGVELTAKYTYHINDKFSIAVGVGNNWLNAAVVNDKIVSKDGKLSYDSLYGIAKGFNDWDYLKSSFVVGRFEMLYQLKKLEIGVAFLKPLGNLYSFSNANINPVNGRLVVRWKIK